MKRSLIPALAAGLLASLAFTAPSEAGTIVTTTLSFGTPTPVTPQATIVVDYSATSGPITSLTDGPSLPAASIVQTGTDQVTVTFTPAASQGIVQFSFHSNVAFANAPTDITISSVSATPGPSSLVKATLSYNNAVVPEPTSMALLGIGMSSFLIYRRFFKRLRVA